MPPSPTAPSSSPTITLLIGLPGSGKSTWARAWQLAVPGRCCVATDAIRQELFGDAAVQGPWRAIEQRAEQLLCQIVQQIHRGEATAAVFDATNANAVHRQQAIALVRQCGFTRVAGLWLDVPLALCLTRNAARDRPVPESVLYAMHQHLLTTPPQRADGFDRLRRRSGQGFGELATSPCKTGKA
jgi:predicted kinase